MSIIIKSNELNTIVYKYLLQAGLSHTAYVMFNEARLESALQQFKFDIKSGHLLMLLQKALIFSQVESHVNFGEYNECLQPFYLLKSHTCKITQKIRHQSTNFIKELNNNLTECIKRTNAIYNTELTNKNYEEIVYEPRGMNYFEKFEKFKIIETDNNQTTTPNSEESDKIVVIDGQKDKVMAVWNRQDNLICLTQNDSFGDEVVIKIYPCTLNGRLEYLQLFKLTPSALIMVFSQNRVKVIFRQEEDRSVQFIAPSQQKITSIHCNPNINNLISFQSKNEFFVLNLKNMEVITQSSGILRWRAYDQYIVFEQGRACLRSLLKQAALIAYVSQEIDQKHFTQIDEIEVSTNKTFFFVASYARSKIWVYTFEKQEPLYVFDFEEGEQATKKVIWVYRNQVDYLCIMTDCAVRVWEVELNAYCLKIDIQKYELGNIVSVAVLEKNDSETFLLTLGSENLLVSDMANQKIQRIESPTNAIQMQNVGRNSVFVLTDESMYFLSGQKLSELFK